jgi:3-oxoacyl-[acyl-carrier protein] reductase
MENKIALITGSGQGIGRAIAIKLAQNKVIVVLNDLKDQEENLKETKNQIQKLGGKAEYIFADVSNLNELEQMINEIKSKFGSLDILINNAGITKDRTLAKMTPEEWKKVIDINLTGVFNCTKAALPLITQSQGKIINISSVVGQKGNFGQTNYAAAKAGIIGFTKSLTKEVGKFGVTVNAIAPGFIESRLTENLPEEMKMMVKKLTALGRFGKPEEVANLVTFLASDQADFITGAVINIDGGLSL